MSTKLSEPQRRMLTNIRDGYQPSLGFDNGGGADRCYNALTRKGLVDGRERTPAGAEALAAVESAEAAAKEIRRQAEAEWLANLTPEQIEARKAPVEQLLNRLKAMRAPGAEAAGAKIKRILDQDEQRIAGAHTWVWHVEPHGQLGSRHSVRTLLAAPQLMAIHSGRDWSVEPYDGRAGQGRRLGLFVEQEKQHG
jgi:hypothetical protein